MAGGVAMGESELVERVVWAEPMRVGRGRGWKVLRKKEEAVREGKTQREETRMMTADWRRVGGRMVRRD